MAGFSKRSVRFQGYLLVLLSTIGFASFGVYAKLVGDTYEVFTQAWTRALIVTVVLLIVGLLTRQLRKIDRADAKWIAVYVGFSIFTVAPIYYAFTQMNIGTATILFYAAYMVASYAIGRIFLNEKLTWAKSVAIALAIIGMGLIFGVELGGVTALALILAIVNGVASGGEVSFTKKISEKYSPLQLTLVSWAVIFVTHLIVAAIVGEELLPVQSTQSLVGIILYALAAMLAFWLVVAGYKRIEAGVGGIIGTLEVPFAMLFGVLLFQEHITIPIVTGAGLIFVAAALPDVVDIIRKKHRRRRDT